MDGYKRLLATITCFLIIMCVACITVITENGRNIVALYCTVNTK